MLDGFNHGMFELGLEQLNRGTSSVQKLCAHPMTMSDLRIQHGVICKQLTDM